MLVELALLLLVLGAVEEPDDEPDDESDDDEDAEDDDQGDGPAVTVVPAKRSVLWGGTEP